MALIGAAIGGSAALGWPVPALADTPVNVVATFSVLGDMVHQVGGQRVRVTTLVGPDGDGHVYQPTPADARALASAQIVFVNGLGFEGWIDRLIRSAGFRGPVVVTTNGIKPLAAEDDHDVTGQRRHGGTKTAHGHHGIDSHAWQSLANGRIYVANIVEGLSMVDPAGRATYQADGERYLAQIDALDKEVREAIARLPPDRRKVVTSHDAFRYFAKAYGLDFLSPEGLSTETEASAAEVGRLIRQIKAAKIPAVFIESISDPRLIEQIRRETGAAIGGTLYSDALSPAGGPAATYLDMFRHNLNALVSALSS